MIVRARATLLAAVIAALCSSPDGRADLADETALAERYAPVVRLVEQVEECGPGEPYEPLRVELLFDEPTVALRGPWSAGDLVQIGPAAEDVTGLYAYHLDFPGNALDPGCDYERWARRLAEGHEPAVYAHVTTDPGYPGRLALQYWLFYAYNDWNNLHEGDWEMIQLVFDAADAKEALSRTPAAVGYSQHEGAERANWGDEKLELLGGTHPVVYPAAGSHANFFDEKLFLGSSAEQGVGCDDTRGPTRELRPAVFTIPSDPDEVLSAFPWITFEGRWGELQPAFFNGPTGPNLKTPWTEPIRWSEESWRDRSLTVPAGGLFGPQATSFFCQAVGSGSRALVRLVAHPLELGLLVAGVVLVLAYALSRVTWRPAAPLRVARRRTWGQVLTASARVYGNRLPLLLGLGLVFLPISILVSLLQTLVLHATSVLGVQAGGESGGALAFVVLVIGTALTLLGLGLVQAVTARALVEHDAGRPSGLLRASRLAVDSIRPLLGALLLAVVLLSLLASSMLGLPLAIWLAGRLALLVPVVELERTSAIGGLWRSYCLVRRRWLKVTSLIVVGGALALVAGPLVGVGLILASDAPLWLVNVVAGVIYALTMPFVALTTTYAYFDARVRDELETEREPSELPAEIELSA